MTATEMVARETKAEAARAVEDYKKSTNFENEVSKLPAMPNRRALRNARGRSPRPSTF